MDYLGLLRDVISMIIVGNAVTGQLDENMTEEYMEVLETILKSGNDNN